MNNNEQSNSNSLKRRFKWKENLAVVVILILFWLLLEHWDEVKHFIATTFL